MNKIAALLGLPETATEEEITAAIKLLQKAGEDAAREKETAATATMEEYKNCVPESSRTLLTGLLITNRAATLEVLNGLKNAAEGKGQPETVRVHNRQGTGKAAPAGVFTSPADGQPVDRSAAQQAAVIEVRNRAGNNSMSHTAAFEIASREKPELFASR